MPANVILRRYINKSYFELLRDAEFVRFLRGQCWIAPSFVPDNNYLRGNQLIRQYFTKANINLLRDLKFQYILIRAGFVQCTSTTTTTSTTI